MTTASSRAGGLPWRPAGDRALLVEMPGDDPASANRRARALVRRLEALELEVVEDLVPGACTVLVVLRPGAEPPPALLRAIEAGPALEADGSEPAPRLLEVPVHYGGEAGPDLRRVADLHGLTPAAVIDLHASALYTVAFLGFMPGFPYLTGLPPALETPRLATPRTRVEAGSVAIAGPYAGIYPRATPGGWNLLGRTETRLFDLERRPPALLRPGDRVRFVPHG